nr:hypothetical protein [Oligoflexales bacterium]
MKTLMSVILILIFFSKEVAFAKSPQINLIRYYHVTDYEKGMVFSGGKLWVNRYFSVPHHEVKFVEIYDRDTNEVKNLVLPHEAKFLHKFGDGILVVGPISGNISWRYTIIDKDLTQTTHVLNNIGVTQNFVGDPNQIYFSNHDKIERHFPGPLTILSPALNGAGQMLFDSERNKAYILERERMHGAMNLAVLDFSKETVNRTWPGSALVKIEDIKLVSGKILLADSRNNKLDVIDAESGGIINNLSIDGIVALEVLGNCVLALSKQQKRISFLEERSGFFYPVGFWDYSNDSDVGPFSDIVVNQSKNEIFVRSGILNCGSTRPCKGISQIKYNDTYL